MSRTRASLSRSELCVKQRALARMNFSEALARHYARCLENGKSSITIDKFEAIASFLSVEPLMMMAMCEAVRKGQSV